MSDIATDTDLTPGVFEAPATPQRLARRPVRLSPRERQIVTFITAGCSNQKIADCLGLKTQTIKNHLCHRQLHLSRRGVLALAEPERDILLDPRNFASVRSAGHAVSHRGVRALRRVNPVVRLGDGARMGLLQP